MPLRPLPVERGALEVAGTLTLTLEKALSVFAMLTLLELTKVFKTLATRDSLKLEVLILLSLDAPGGAGIALDLAAGTRVLLAFWLRPAVTVSALVRYTVTVSVTVRVSVMKSSTVVNSDTVVESCTSVTGITIAGCVESVRTSVEGDLPDAIDAGATVVGVV